MMRSSTARQFEEFGPPGKRWKLATALWMTWSILGASASGGAPVTPATLPPQQMEGTGPQVQNPAPASPSATCERKRSFGAGGGAAARAAAKEDQRRFSQDPD